MLVLTQTTDNLQISLSRPITTNQLSIMSCWRDVTTNTYTPGRTLAQTNNTTDVNIVPAPSSQTQRVIDFINIHNADTAPATVTVKLDANGMEYILWQGLLSPNDRLEYTDDKGFTVYNFFGAQKVQNTIGNIVSAGNWVNVTLGTNVVNANPVANTIQDCTGLSFDVMAGASYQFIFDVTYTAASTNTGSRWSVTMPNAFNKQYWSEYSLTATTRTVGSYVGNDLPAGSNATTPDLISRAIVRGAISPSEDGVVKLRFASEVASSAITALAFLSTLDWRQTA